MPLRETTVARLGLVALAVALWKSAGPIVFDGLLPHYPIAVVLLTVTYIASFVALLMAASSTDKVQKVASAAIVALVIATVVYALRDGVRKATADFYPTTDGHVFMETAARFLLQGKNPYAMGLAEGFRVYRLPLSHVTPLLDGDFSDRQAYPALSFLALVPALAARVPTYIVYATAFVAAVAVAVQKAPWWARPLVVSVFMLDEAYFAFSFGGVTDTVWVLFVVGAIVWWRSRPALAAVLIGLACAYKQHPWFLVPLLVIRIAHETKEKPWGPSVRRFLGIVGAVFAIINVPFVLIGPHRWFLGVTEPLVAPMVQLSEGLTAFSMTGWVVMPRQGTSLIFWARYAMALFAYARHTRTLRDWCWIVPSVVFWFGYRALMSYWYFFAIVALAAMFSREGPEDEPEGGASWRPTAIGAAAALPWVIDFGPHELPAGKSAEYVIRAAHARPGRNRRDRSRRAPDRSVGPTRLRRARESHESSRSSRLPAVLGPVRRAGPRPPGARPGYLQGVGEVPSSIPLRRDAAKARQRAHEAERL